MIRCRALSAIPAVLVLMVQSLLPAPAMAQEALVEKRVLEFGSIARAVEPRCRG